MKLSRLLFSGVLGAFLLGAIIEGAVGDASGSGQSVIVVVGAGGTAEYADQFERWAGLWKSTCSRGGAEFVEIGGGDEGGRTDRAILKEALSRESQRGDGALWIVLIGHGTFDGRVAKFNLRGPDFSADELGAWLGGIERPVAVINSASSSGPFLPKLSGAGRVVITATKSGFEQNFARFGGFLAEAVAEPSADLDKDGQTSLLEAYLTACHLTDEFYSSSGRLTTEHALLDDNGDGLGTRADWFRGIRPVQKAADDAELDGYRAGQFHLVYSETEKKMSAEARGQRDRLELGVMSLRDAKDSYGEEEYFSKLESLLVQIARIYEQTEGQGSSDGEDQGSVP